MRELAGPNLMIGSRAPLGSQKIVTTFDLIDVWSLGHTAAHILDGVVSEENWSGDALPTGEIDFTPVCQEIAAFSLTPPVIRAAGAEVYFIIVVKEHLSNTTISFYPSKMIT